MRQKNRTPPSDRPLVRLYNPRWVVQQVSFIAGAHSLNEEDLRKNLQVFKVPQAGIVTIRSKLAMKIYDEYANILRDCRPDKIRKYQAAKEKVRV